MTKNKQTRRSISVSGDLYWKLKDYCEREDISLSAYVEELTRNSIGMDPRDVDVAARVVSVPSVPLRTKPKPAMKAPEPKEPPQEASTTVLPPTPVQIVPAKTPEKIEDVRDPGGSGGLRDEYVREPPKADIEEVDVNICATDDFLEDDFSDIPVRPRPAPPVAKPFTPDAPKPEPDPATQDVLAEREARTEALTEREKLELKRRAKFDEWAKKHSTSASDLKPNGRRRGGNVHLF